MCVVYCLLSPFTGTKPPLTEKPWQKGVPLRNLAAGGFFDDIS